MEFDWTHAGFEADARRELGAELAEIIDHFPRVVHALFAQMQNARDTGGTFPRSEFVRQVLAELPKSCDEVLPFFVRSIWNKIGLQRPMHAKLKSLQEPLSASFVSQAVS